MSLYVSFARLALGFEHAFNDTLSFTHPKKKSLPEDDDDDDCHRSDFWFNFILSHFIRLGFFFVRARLTSTRLLCTKTKNDDDRVNGFLFYIPIYAYGFFGGPHCKCILNVHCNVCKKSLRMYHLCMCTVCTYWLRIFPSMCECVYYYFFFDIFYALLACCIRSCSLQRLVISFFFLGIFMQLSWFGHTCWTHVVCFATCRINWMSVQHTAQFFSFVSAIRTHTPNKYFSFFSIEHIPIEILACLPVLCLCLSLGNSATLYKLPWWKFIRFRLCVNVSVCAPKSNFLNKYLLNDFELNNFDFVSVVMQYSAQRLCLVW